MESNKIIVVGIGPGHPDYVVPIAARYISEAKVLIGSARALETFGRYDSTQVHHAIKGKISVVLDFIEDSLQHSDVVVMVSGDPGYYSMLDAIKKRFVSEKVLVVPGISSVQMAFARIGIPWQEGEFISMHGRNPDDMRLAYRPGRMVAFLSDKYNNSHSIPARLIALGWPDDAQLFICSRLSYDDEVVESIRLADYSQIKEEYTACVLVVKA